MTYPKALWVCLFLVLPGLHNSAVAQQFSVAGAVLQPGSHPWHPEARLRDAVAAAQVRADAWFLGAALLRGRALEPQKRLKAGILFDLRANRLHARVENNQPLVELLNRLDSQVSALPVTGRITARLAPFDLLLPQHNLPLEAGDQLTYPTRPTQLRVMGAVQADCVLAHDPALSLRDYLGQCPAHPAASRDHVFVIQPDGHVQHTGIAHWNEQPVNIAVGAILYRPLHAARLLPESGELNSDLAALLATQYQLGGHLVE